jgi:hypothetical protein
MVTVLLEQLLIMSRHEEDGCQRRNQVPVTDPGMFRSHGYSPATAL